MRMTQETRRAARNKNMGRRLMTNHHCETCGLFVEDGSFRPPFWDDLINSLDKFSADFMIEQSAVSRKGS